MSGSESRKYARFDKECRVRYRVLETDEPPHEGISVNISGGGLCMRSKNSISRGKTLALQIEIDGLQNPLLALGMVVWTRKDDAVWHESGITFWWVGRQLETSQDPRLEYVKNKLRL